MLTWLLPADSFRAPSSRANSNRDLGADDGGEDRWESGRKTEGGREGGLSELLIVWETSKGWRDGKGMSGKKVRKRSRRGKGGRGGRNAEGERESGEERKNREEENNAGQEGGERREDGGSALCTPSLALTDVSPRHGH